MAYNPDKRHPNEEQIANAPDWLFPLMPASSTPAQQTRKNWAAVLTDQHPPLIEERHDG